MKSWLQDNNIVMYSTVNERKSVLAERFIRNLKNKIYKYMTSISKNVYIDKLDDIVNKYNNTYHRTIKVKPINVKDNAYINFGEEVNDKDPKFKIYDHVKILKYKNIFAKGYTPSWSEEIFVIKKVKNAVPWTCVISDLNSEEIAGTFYEKELQKTNQKEFRIEKVIKKKEIIYMSNGKVMTIHLILGMIKKTLYKISQYFPKPYDSFGGDINVIVDLSNYATKTDLKKATGIDTSKLALKSNLANLKAEIDKIDVDKLKTVPVDLSKLSNVVNDDVVKKTAYDKLVTKVNNIDSSGFVLKTKYDRPIKKITDTDKKIPDTSGLVKKTGYNTKITEIESKIPSLSGSATNFALTAAENKILDVSNLVKKKTDYDAKASDIESKYITTAYYNKFTNNIVDNSIKSKKLVDKSAILGS